jgi:hypothetical protein
VLAAHRGELLALPGVVGVGEGEERGEPCVVVLVDGAVELPTELDGYRVVARGSGPLRARSE